MESLQAQAPIIVAFLAAVTPVVLYTARLYERLVSKAEEREKLAVERAEKLTGLLERLSDQQQELARNQMDLLRAYQGLEFEIRRGERA